jgi:hypothetical protein
MWRDGEPSRVEAGLGSSGVREPEGAGLRMRGTTKTMSPARGLSTVTNLAEAGGATGQPPPGGALATVWLMDLFVAAQASSHIGAGRSDMVWPQAVEASSDEIRMHWTPQLALVDNLPPLFKRQATRLLKGNPTGGCHAGIRHEHVRRLALATGYLSVGGGRGSARQATAPWRKRG